MSLQHQDRQLLRPLRGAGLLRRHRQRAGKVALAAGNRDGELFFTTDAARTFAKRIVDAGFERHLRLISNPCDVVCTELWHLTGYDPRRSSARLRPGFRPPAHRDLQKVGVSPKSIDAYMIGEHGFSQLAAFKAATIAGKSLNELQAENPDKYAFDHMEVEELARKGGYVTYQGKQCTEYAVANSAARVCAAVLHNEHAVLSASTLMTGQYGEEGIFTSLPCVIGAEGVEEVYTLDLSEHELEGFHKSCQHIRDNIAQLDWWDAEAYDAKVGRRLPQPCESMPILSGPRRKPPARPASQTHAVPLRIEVNTFSRYLSTARCPVARRISGLWSNTCFRGRRCSSQLML
ncbi:MAG: hypothetical protein ACLU37_08155 [Collinsella sp.]